MVDKALRREKHIHRYSNEVIRRVPSYGYGKDNKYKNKPHAVCYWTAQGGNFVTYDASKVLMKLRRIRWKLSNFFRVLKEVLK